MKLNLLAVIKWAAAAIVSAWAGLGPTVQLLVILMGIDFGTGLTKGFVSKRLNTDVSFRGLLRKVMILGLVYVGHIISEPLALPFALGKTIAIAYIVNEVLSIVENCADVGVPIPPILTQSLSKMRSLIPVPTGSSISVIKTEETVIIQPASDMKKPDAS